MELTVCNYLNTTVLSHGANFTQLLVRNSKKQGNTWSTLSLVILAARNGSENSVDTIHQVPSSASSTRRC